jgi:hypothetical protein
VEFLDETGQDSQGVIARQPGLDHQIGPAPLFPIRHLAGDDRRDVGFTHVPAQRDAVDLERARGRDDDDGIDPHLAAGLEQQRDIQHHRSTGGPPRPLHEGAFIGFDHRMQDMFQPGERLAVAEHGLTQRDSIDSSALRGSRKRRLDRFHRSAASRLRPVHREIGVEHWDARPAEGSGSGGFSHTDAAGQADYSHPGRRSAATNRRSASSTVGSTPNHVRNPGMAW